MRIHHRFVIAACIAAIGMTSCSTRIVRKSLGADWPGGEPAVDLGVYESVQQRPGQRSDVALAVAISGGGMRAANFAAGVLKALEDTPVRGPGGRMSNLLREVDYFSTVSGGGMAAAAYITSLAQHRRQHPDDIGSWGFSFANADGSGGEPVWQRSLGRNYRSSLAGAFFNPRMAGELDRGDILESRLDEHVLGREDGRSLTLGDIFAAKGTTPHLPYWVTNATVYENGAIFPFTPDILRTYGITGYNHRMKGARLAAAEDMPLSIGLKASASFPVAIPPTTMRSSRDPSHPRLHLLDGGVADNLGIVTALRLLRQDKAPRKALIVIDAYNGKVEPFSKVSIRPGMILTALRSTSISLDSAHQRVDNLLGVAGAASGIRCAVVDFNRSVREGEPEAVEASAGMEALPSMESLKRDEGSPQSIQAVFTQALGVGTWFRIREETQQTLLRAGENAIFRNSSAAEGTGRRLLAELQAVRSLF